MGGFGSGRYCRSGKGITTNLPALDVRMLQREGLLVPGMTSSLRWSMNGNTLTTIQIRTEVDSVTLDYENMNHEDEVNVLTHIVHLDWTECHLGGRRTWFRCPGCGQRVAILYGGLIFACRHCHKLAYASQRERSHDGAVRKANRLREKLGWGPGIMNIDRSKPKGMHLTTFERLKAKHGNCQTSCRLNFSFRLFF